MVLYQDWKPIESYLSKVCKLEEREKLVENKAAHPYLGVVINKAINQGGYANGKVQERKIGCKGKEEESI